jgi:hypothetical protein
MHNRGAVAGKEKISRSIAIGCIAFIGLLYSIMTSAQRLENDTYLFTKRFRKSVCFSVENPFKALNRYTC